MSDLMPYCLKHQSSSASLLYSYFGHSVVVWYSKSVCFLTKVMATVFALVAGGFLIATRPIERMMARTIKQICVTCTRNFQVSSKERMEESIVAYGTVRVT